MMMLMLNMIFFMGVVGFSLNRKHLLMMLLMLEFIVLSLFFLMFMMLLNYSFELYFCMIFMSLSVCESALSLSLLVSIIRTHGSDNFFFMNLLW